MSDREQQFERRLRAWFRAAPDPEVPTMLAERLDQLAMEEAPAEAHRSRLVAGPPSWAAIGAAGVVIVALVAALVPRGSSPPAGVPSPSASATSVTTPEPEGPGPAIDDWAMLGAADGWVKSSQHLFFTSDGGATWDDRGLVPGSRPDSTTLFFATPRIGFAAADVLERTTDGGRTWRPVSLPSHGGTAAEFSFLTPADGYLLETAYGQGPGTLLRTSDGGASWTVVSTTAEALVSDLRFVDANTGWVLGSTETAMGRPLSNALFVTRDAGRTFQAEQLPAPDGYVSGQLDHMGGAPRRMDGGWMVGATFANADLGLRTEFLVTTDLGRTWRTVWTVGGDSAAMPMAVFDAKHWLAWLEGGDGLATTEDGGTTWAPVHAGGLPANVGGVRRMQFTDPRKGWMEVDLLAPGGYVQGTQLYRTADGGGTWTPLVIPAPGDLSTRGEIKAPGEPSPSAGS